MQEITKTNRNFAPLEFVEATNNHNVVLCKGTPESIEDDVQWYFFKCDRCDGDCIQQAQFFKKDGLLCAECASKIGFRGVYHHNASKKMLSRYDGCSCDACSYRRRNPN